MAFSSQLCCPLPQSSCSVFRVRKRDTFSWVGISDIGKGSWNSPGKNESDSHALGLWNLNNPRRCMLLSSLYTEADRVSEKSRDLAKWQWLLSVALRSLLLSWLQSFLQRLQSLSSQGVGERGVQFCIFSSSKKHLTMSEETFGCCALRKEMLSASSGWKVGMLLSVRQCRGQCTTTKNSTCLICQQSQGRETFLQSWEKEKEKKQTQRRESMASLEHVGLETLEASWVKSEIGLQTKRARRDQRKRQTLQTARHRFNKQEDSHVRLVLGRCKTSRSLHLPTRIWSLYRGLNGVWSCILSWWSQQCLALSGLCPWNSSGCGNSGQNIYYRDRDCMWRLWLPGLSSWSNHLSHPLNIFLRKNKEGKTKEEGPANTAWQRSTNHFHRTQNLTTVLMPDV